jgi:predicted nucleic acid-binding protein
MSGLGFLDTNILVYCFIEGDNRKRARARALVRSALDRHIRNPFAQ